MGVVCSLTLPLESTELTLFPFLAKSTKNGRNETARVRFFFVWANTQKQWKIVCGKMPDKCQLGMCRYTWHTKTHTSLLVAGHSFFFFMDAKRLERPYFAVSCSRWGKHQSPCLKPSANSLLEQASCCCVAQARLIVSDKRLNMLQRTGNNLQSSAKWTRLCPHVVTEGESLSCLSPDVLTQVQLSDTRWNVLIADILCGYLIQL